MMPPPVQHDAFWNVPSPTETLLSYAEQLRLRAQSAQDAINRAYEDIGRYTARLEQTRASIAQIEAAVTVLTKATP